MQLDIDLNLYNLKRFKNEYLFLHIMTPPKKAIIEATAERDLETVTELGEAANDSIDAKQGGIFAHAVDTMTIFWTA